MRKVIGKMTEERETINGKDTYVSIFETSKEELQKAGFENIANFGDYIEGNKDTEEILAYDSTSNQDLSGRLFHHIDGIRISGHNYVHFIF